MVETSTRRVSIPENIVRNIGLRRYIKLNKKKKVLKRVGGQRSCNICIIGSSD